ncbi:TetR/AcrR family transcriptional regulator C-terminal domain-containing protein [Streptomyces caniscabiei]|uniref:TetR/AcrR family transcriptional regulator C-terminal domain-containing protein n=1 Tax=Streptomyces caniscabiei TaxID=2746961 RepID=A0A927QL48_9ACTN|nr:TetR/AcrR family transcriptional regulator C-terminal domain-containing protein [Streptomyces caniscabiei]MBD9701748.1 TetR/AcrR family transcriptional regulator C-terminal domain-containing protein [Streptomyces caniscabiei]MBD9724514.1 TetR/AcrR family transcriptional regulator C-terminal domain-containing protein [Streptomyces caniscabiei]MDX3507926.1 TetR/AcrR family transcriptional regulator C-terminal domain-containing protein [Streptomyces caniscabiei]MDX3717888.1 TetR/AcrR family tra
MAMEPPYLRIAGDIRRRIASGELAPGTRIPSTRRITQEWGVAMATATKALATLNQEGLVRAVPGVGTVVAEPGREGPATPRHGLTRDRIIRAAIALVDTEGLAALSMRRVATDFGVSTMALYRHVPSKGELVRLMSEAVFDGEPLGSRPPGWREQLEREARWLWGLYQRHPWLARAMAALTRPMASPHAMRYTERVLSALNGLGLTPTQIIHVHLALLGYAQGVAAAVELESQARQDTGMTPEEWMASNEPRMETIQAAGSYPILSTLFDQEEFDLELDTLFEFGLARMLDGVESLIEKTGG